jgi:PTS system fructose-specific IIC component
MAFGATLAVPHGGLFVFFAVSNLGGYLVAIAAGTALTAAMLGVLKKNI